MTENGFNQTDIDQCVLNRGENIILIYVNDCVIFSKEMKWIEEITGKLIERYTITDKNKIKEYLEF